MNGPELTLKYIVFSCFFVRANDATAAKLENRKRTKEDKDERPTERASEGWAREREIIFISKSGPKAYESHWRGAGGRLYLLGSSPYPSKRKGCIG